MSGLDPAVIADLNKSVLPKVRKDFADTQALSRYVGVREIANRGETVSVGQDYREGWRWRQSAAMGPEPNRPYKATPAHYTEGMREASIRHCINVDKNMVWDLLELEANKGNSERIYQLIKARHSMQREGINNWLEAQVFGIPQNASDIDNMHGLLTWARRSMNSSGVFVAQSTVQFNATYQTWGDGTTTGTLAGVDCTAASNDRFRSAVATHNNTVDETLLNLIMEMMDALMWDPLSDLQGRFEVGEQVQFWPQAMHLDYLKLINKGNDDRGSGGKGDFFPIRKATANGGRIIGVPKLNDYSWKPIVFVDRSELKLRKAAGRWDNENKPEKFTDSHTSFYTPTDFIGQIWCEVPRNCIGCLHGSF